MQVADTPDNLWCHISIYIELNCVVSKMLFKKSCINILAHYAVAILPLLLSLLYEVKKRVTWITRPFMRPSVTYRWLNRVCRLFMKFAMCRSLHVTSKIYPFFLELSSDLNKILCRRIPINTTTQLLSNYEFCANWHSESHSLLGDID
jgi:transposase